MNTNSTNYTVWNKINNTKVKEKKEKEKKKGKEKGRLYSRPL